MRITPVAAGEAFKLKVSVSIEDLAVPCTDIPLVVKDRAFRIKLPHEAGHILFEKVGSLQTKLAAGLRIGGVKTFGFHLGAAVTVGAHARHYNVEE